MLSSSFRELLFSLDYPFRMFAVTTAQIWVYYRRKKNDHLLMKYLV